MNLHRLMALPLLLGLGASSGPAIAQTATTSPTVLRVGVLTGSQPCSDQQSGHWQGLAVELWSRLARREGLPYVLSSRSTPAALLAAVENSTLDVGVGCLTITPERVNAVRFSLPFQEMGLGVMEERTQLEAGEAVIRSLMSRDLLQLLATYLASIALVSSLLWQCEEHGSSAEQRKLGQRRTFAKVFQILATGAGTNTIASTTRGQGLVLFSYLIRIVTASLLVTTITVKVVQQQPGLASLTKLADLAGRRVAARPGSVSEQVLRQINARNHGSRPPIRIVPLPEVIDAPTLLLEQRVDAVLAEDQQLRFALQAQRDRRLAITLQGLQPESQAFALAPDLNPTMVARINLGLSVLKRSGEVRRLQAEALGRR
jgi:polar amino acid transport system substrate-binding protein